MLTANDADALGVSATKVARRAGYRVAGEVQLSARSGQAVSITAHIGPVRGRFRPIRRPSTPRESGTHGRIADGGAPGRSLEQRTRRSAAYDSANARLTLALLRDAIRHDPDKLTAILHEVVALSEADRETLTQLLSETTLAAIIKSANLITSRHKFLGGLEHLLYDPDDSPTVGERDHLHRILERELWIFGEAYHLMSSERGLTELLRTHLRLEGLPAKDARTVTRWDGKTGRVDLHLAAKYQEHDRVRHLIVELKAPGITVGRKELDQVEDYGNAILSGPQFSSSTAHWDLILVTASLDDIAQNRIHGDDFELGRFWAPAPKPGQPRVTAYVRRWRDIIDENKRRLDFVTSALEHDPTISEGLDYVREKYADLLPASFAELADLG